MRQFTTAQQIAADIASSFRADGTLWRPGALAFDIDGNPCTSLSKAVQFSLQGAITCRAIGQYDLAQQTLHAFEVALGFPPRPGAIIGPLRFNSWHDAPERVAADIVALCEQVARSQAYPQQHDPVYACPNENEAPAR
jgi:hypothetical protein